MAREKKRTPVYNPDADKRWRELNRDKANYQSAKRAARSFVRKATQEDLEELALMIEAKKSELS